MLDPYVSDDWHRYQVLDKLDEGGMGAVYRVTDRLSGQKRRPQAGRINHTRPDDHRATCAMRSHKNSPR